MGNNERINKLRRSIEAFEKLRVCATADPFLEVYGTNNRLMVKIEGEDFERVLRAAKKHLRLKEAQ